MRHSLHCSNIFSFIYYFCYIFIYSITYLWIQAFIHSFMHPLSFHLFMQSFMNFFILSPIRAFIPAPFHPFTYSSIHSCTLSFFHLFMHSFLHPFILSPIHAFISAPFHPFSPIHAFIHASFHIYLHSFLHSFLNLSSFQSCILSFAFQVIYTGVHLFFRRFFLSWFYFYSAKFFLHKDVLLNPGVFF